ncbi:MAG: hypothetical protein MZV63_32445 [Marinilabiliales bacterium]|nr:hypothetical protein [Marinilabiliales bacterium]
MRRGSATARPWGILRDVEHHLGFQLVEKRRGGAAGGRTVLSHQGRQLLRAYNSLNHETDIAMKSIAKGIFQPDQRNQRLTMRNTPLSWL